MALISLRVPDELLNLLKSNANCIGCSVSKYIRVKLEESLLQPKGNLVSSNNNDFNRPIDVFERTVENTFLLRTLVKFACESRQQSAKEIIDACVEQAKIRSHPSTD